MNYLKGGNFSVDWDTVDANSLDNRNNTSITTESYGNVFIHLSVQGWWLIYH